AQRAAEEHRRVTREREGREPRAGAVDDALAPRRATHDGHRGPGIPAALGCALIAGAGKPTRRAKATLDSARCRAPAPRRPAARIREARSPRSPRARLPRPAVRDRGLARGPAPRHRRRLVAPRTRRRLRARGPLDRRRPAAPHGAGAADGAARVAVPGLAPRAPRARRVPGSARAPRRRRCGDPRRGPRDLPPRGPLARRGGARDRGLRVPRLVSPLPAAPRPRLDPRLPAPRGAALRAGGARGSTPRRRRAALAARLGDRPLGLRRP